MRHLAIAAVAACVTVSAIEVRAQSFTAQELDRMSQERLNNGDFRKFAAPPAPPKTTPNVVLHKPPGIWLCLNINDDTPILAAPSGSAAVIGRSARYIAAGPDQGDFTSVLLHEGKIGFVPKSTIHEYHNQFNPNATCTVQGLRPDGVVQYLVR